MYIPSGQFREVWTEHLRSNQSSFSSTFASDSWSLTARGQLSPARVQAGQTPTRDSTAYPTAPADGAWWTRRNGYTSPARPGAARGSFPTGSVT